MLTYNTRLILAPDDRRKLLDMLEAQRFAWNECSPIVFGLRQNSIVLLHKKFYKKFRKKNPETPAQVVIRAEQECLSAYRSIKSNKHKIDSPCQKKKLSIRLDKRLYAYENGEFRITTLEKRVKCKPHLYPRLQELLEKYPFCDPLLFERDGEVWISLTFKQPEYVPTQTLACGIDLGVKVIAATSEGNIHKDKKFNAEKRRLRYIKRKLDSHGSRSAKKHLKKLRRKEKNKNRHLCRHLANKLLQTKADVIVLEDLKGLKKKKNKFQNKNKISQIPFFLIKTILTYKALLLRKQVITVSPAYTSQIDHRTKKRDGIRKGRRYYGTDGIVLDADVNAAINIAAKSEHPVSIGSYLDGQAVVNRPIVSTQVRDKPPTL